MEQLSQTVKVKRRAGFHNFFLGAVLFHLIVFVILNAHRVVRLDVSKEAFLKFTLIKMPPSQEIESQLKKEIAPQKTEIKVKANVQEPVTPKAFKEVEEVQPMGVMQVEERDLLREKLESFVSDNISDKLGANVALPSLFRHSEAKVALDGHVPRWESGADVSGGTNELGGKKKVQRYSYGQMAFKQLISRLPDWVEKSSKVIITTVRVWINPDGDVTKAEVVKSSGYLELDQLAIDSIKNRSFKPSADGAGRIAVIEIDFTNIR
ncbi:MAG: TonB family protein [bacterium]